MLGFEGRLWGVLERRDDGRERDGLSEAGQPPVEAILCTDGG